MINHRAFWIYLTQMSILIFLGVLGFWLITPLYFKLIFLTGLFIIWLHCARTYLKRITLVKRHQEDK